MVYNISVMATAVQDPQQLSNINSPAERDKINAVPKTNAVPLEVMWERQYEQEQSLKQEQSNAVAEVERILFPPSGSMMNEFKPVEVTSETMFNPDMFRDMFEKPLKDMTNIASGIASRIASETPGALIDLGKHLAGVVEPQPEIKPEKQKEAQNAQWQAFVTQKTGETNASVSQVRMQRRMEEALYIVGAPPTEDTAAELNLNTGMDIKNLNTIDKLVWLARKRSKDMRAAKKAEQTQEEAEVQGPKIVANMNENIEGGLVGGATSHIMPINAGG